MKTQPAGATPACIADDKRGQGAADAGVNVTVGVAVMGLAAVTSAGVAAPASAQAATAQEAPAICATSPASSGCVPLAFVKVHDVQGNFSCSQDVVTPTEQVVRDMRGIGHVLGDKDTPANPVVTPLEQPLDWRLSVTGSVGVPFTATLGELAREGSHRAVMSYTCMNNPADGRATANADTTGVTVSSILERAGVAEDANVVTFVSMDGYEISLPLGYVTEHRGMIVYRLNDEPLSRSVGCTNQLWLSGVSAHYFVRDVKAIGVSRVNPAKLPPIPGSPASGDVYRNRPNVGVLGGYFIA